MDSFTSLKSPLRRSFSTLHLEIKNFKTVLLFCDTVQMAETPVRNILSIAKGCNNVNELDLRKMESYSYWTDEVIRFADLDRVGHVNNTAFATYSESGRVDFLETVYPGSTGGHGIGWVIAKITIHYLAAAYYPGKVKIGTLVRKIGNSSVVIEQGLFCNDKCFSTIENVMVWADTQNEKSVPLPDDLRENLQDYLR